MLLAVTTPGPRAMRALPTLVLLGVTASWGSTFFLIKDLLHEISVVDFLALRFALAGLVAFALAHRTVFRLSRRDLGAAVALGLIYGSAQLLQTTGLSHTAASVSGFVTGMYVVATPIFAAGLFSERIRFTVWLAVLLAATGLGFLALNGFSVSAGVGLIFAAAMLYAVHIVGLGQWSRTENAVGLSVVQLMVIGALCLAATAWNGVGHPATAGGWTSLIYMALIPGALAILGQTWAQAHLPATRTAVIMTTEPVWAAFFAVLFGGESLTVRMAVGGAFVLAAMYVVELGPRRGADDEPPERRPQQPPQVLQAPHLPL
jgi:drug/metabolite transporter (DMT)-like permease